MVLGHEVVIGHTALEKLDLCVDGVTRRLIPNPAHPDQPVSKVKEHRRSPTPVTTGRLAPFRQRTAEPFMTSIKEVLHLPRASHAKRTRFAEENHGRFGTGLHDVPIQLAAGQRIHSRTLRRRRCRQHRPSHSRESCSTS